MKRKMALEMFLLPAQHAQAPVYIGYCGGAQVAVSVAVLELLVREIALGPLDQAVAPEHGGPEAVPAGGDLGPLAHHLLLDLVPEAAKRLRRGAPGEA